MLHQPSPQLLQLYTNVSWHLLCPNSAYPHSLSPVYGKLIGKLLHNSQVSNQVLLTSLFYLSKMASLAHRATIKNFQLTYTRVVASLMLANKFLDDQSYTTKSWAQISGVPVQKLIQLEKMALAKMDYQVNVSVAQWTKWVSYVKDTVVFLALKVDVDSLIATPKVCPVSPVHPATPFYAKPAPCITPCHNVNVYPMTPSSPHITPVSGISHKRHISEDAFSVPHFKRVHYTQFAPYVPQQLTPYVAQTVTPFVPVTVAPLPIYYGQVYTPPMYVQQSYPMSYYVPPVLYPLPYYEPYSNACY
ncbi:hypothetical protein BABINDRAFT_163417 [Babjeviella inositovora NRRL Y-12698]|uniref:Cyclin-like domain-containing protein n=1 Tax=Babjeviella inositovora NRRL Y-12698 TaxID=984486 RepID=A0A1E3QJ39_9ASCO|nr:uncharacterized protein BABINDRAFT_163417 [Babjeviella inositovora NRRL Y-12698]ODQ77711.1 hypothetical protein BABINDRAFT_163417 [Babjeviella inositovora NRRL Y-12698]